MPDMEITGQKIPARPSPPFCERAAWISLLTPIAASAIVYGTLALDFPHGDGIPIILSCVLLALIASCVFGLGSLLWFRKHRRPLTRWIALAGALVSGGLVYPAFGLLALSCMGHNC